MSNKENLVFIKIECPEVLNEANMLEKSGLIMKNNQYVYLKIDDDFIHKLCPKLARFNNIEKPPYFSDPYNVGAHISIAYPDENMIIEEGILGKKYDFTIKELILVKSEEKESFIIFVESKSLLDLRVGYGLPKELNYKGNEVALHITIGTCSLEI